MHFYEFNIGDFAKKTQHLTNEEELAYRRALDMYYDTENPLLTTGLATLSRRLRVSENALKNVLDEFFPNGKNKHADEKIAEYYEYLERQKTNGRKGGRPKNNPVLTQPYPSANPVPSQPLTTKPLTNIYVPPIPDNLFKDYSKIRKAKKAGELTETAFKQIEKEAAKVGLNAIQAIEICCKRAWVGFEKSWLSESDLPKNVRRLQL